MALAPSEEVRPGIEATTIHKTKDIINARMKELVGNSHLAEMHGLR